MAHFLYVNDDDNVRKVNIDELYENKQRRDLKQLSIFNKILNRIHKRITITGRTKNNARHVWFNIPEYIFGEPLYDKSDCIAYIVTKLEENGFFLRYIHPNTLFISWENWVPSYVRNELKKKTGMVIDEKGQIIENKNEDKSDDVNYKMMNDKNNNIKEQKNYTSVKTYKPTGNLVYTQDIFEKLEKKFDT